MDGVSVLTSTTALETHGSGAGQADSDDDSVVSDYSEMGVPVKEHLTSIHLLQEAELRFGAAAFGLQLACGSRLRPTAVHRRPDDEDEVDFLRRQRKLNFLSLAQEFAAVKRQNPEALPFDVRRQRNDEDEDSEEDESDETALGEFATVCLADEERNDAEPNSAVQKPIFDDFCNAKSDNHAKQNASATSSLSKSVGAVDNDCAVGENCTSVATAVTVSSIPDVVKGLHDNGGICSALDKSDISSAEVVDDSCPSGVVVQCVDDFKTVGESADAVVLHSSNVDWVSVF